MLLLKPKFLTLALAKWAGVTASRPLLTGTGFSRSHPLNPLIPGILNVLSLLFENVFTFKIEQCLELFAFLQHVSLSVSDFKISKPYGLVGIWILDIKSSKPHKLWKLSPRDARRMFELW